MIGFGRFTARCWAATPPFEPESLYASGESGGWYDPSDASTLFQDTAGTTPALVGDPVGRIEPKYGGAPALLQATAGSRPFLRQDGAGNYYLETDGNDDDLYGAVGLTSQFFVAAAIRLEVGVYANPGPFKFLRTGGAITVDSDSLLEDYTSSAAMTRRAIVSRFPAGTVHLDATPRRPGADANHVSFINNGATMTVGTIYPGSPYGLTDIGAKVVAADATAMLHLCRGYADNRMKGRVYGFVYLGRAATAAERAGVNAYLMEKSGVTA